MQEFAEKLIDQTNIYLILFDMLFYSMSAQSAPGAIEHKELIQIFKNRNKKVVETNVRNHIGNAMNNLRIENVQFRSLGDIF